MKDVISPDDYKSFANDFGKLLGDIGYTREEDQATSPAPAPMANLLHKDLPANRPQAARCQMHNRRQS